MTTEMLLVFGLLIVTIIFIYQRLLEQHQATL